MWVVGLVKLDEFIVDDGFEMKGDVSPDGVRNHVIASCTVGGEFGKYIGKSSEVGWPSSRAIELLTSGCFPKFVEFRLERVDL